MLIFIAIQIVTPALRWGSGSVFTRLMTHMMVELPIGCPRGGGHDGGFECSK
ncbi:MAG: hypothetical protein KAI76_07975 [Alphaproteobacteria bacterium]|nr:hypothetical protein [Alphaproteobacteria bacterium]